MSKQYIEDQKWDEDDQGSRSQRPPSLKPALSRDPLQAALAANRLSVGTGIYRL